MRGVSENRDQARAGVHGRSPRHQRLDDMPRHHMYAPGQVLRLQQYAALAAQRNGGAFFFDLEQNPESGASAPGSCVPTKLTHGTLHSFSHDRPVLAEELFQAHGFNSFSHQTTWPASSVTMEILQELGLSPAQKLKLLGNGWHLPSVTSWLYYSLAHTVKLNRNVSIQPELTLLRKGGSSSFGRGGSSQSPAGPRCSSCQSESGPQ